MTIRVMPTTPKKNTPMNPPINDTIRDIIEYALEQNNDPATALVDYYEEKGSAVPIAYSQAAQLVEDYRLLYGDTGGTAAGLKSATVTVPRHASMYSTTAPTTSGDVALTPPEKQLIICEHCGRWVTAKELCEHCGAPVNPTDGD